MHFHFLVFKKKKPPTFFRFGFLGGWFWLFCFIFGDFFPHIEVESMVQIGRDICYSKPRNSKWAVCIKAILLCITWPTFYPKGSVAKGGPDDINEPVLACLTLEHNVLHMWQQWWWQFGRRELTIGPSIYGIPNQRSQRSSGTGGNGAKKKKKEKETGQKKRLTRGMLTLKESQSKKKGAGRENQAQLYWLGNMNTTCK